jgi:hypothetical protein
MLESLEPAMLPRAALALFGAEDVVGAGPHGGDGQQKIDRSEEVEGQNHRFAADGEQPGESQLDHHHGKIGARHQAVLLDSVGQIVEDLGDQKGEQHHHEGGHWQQIGVELFEKERIAQRLDQIIGDQQHEQSHEAEQNAGSFLRLGAGDPTDKPRDGGVQVPTRALFGL